jgi:hypothetical protein
MMIGMPWVISTPRQLDAGGARQHPVEQDQVRLAVDDGGVGLLGVLRLQAFVAGHLQGHGDHLADRRFVVNDEDCLANHGLASGILYCAALDNGIITAM